MSVFILKNLPNRSCLEFLESRYPEMNADSAEAYLHFMRAGAELGASINKYFSDYEMSSGRITVMMILNATQEPISPAKIAERCNVSRATITGLIESLHKSDLVDRQSDEKDRRRVKVKLTDAGQALIDRILPGYFNFMVQSFGKLTADERKTLIKIINKLEPNFHNNFIS